MTINEVIEILKVAIAEIEWGYPMDYVVAFGLAIKLLDKQVQREPKISDWDAYCPSCGHELYNDYNVCPECGQWIKWQDIPDTISGT